MLVKRLHCTFVDSKKCEGFRDLLRRACAKSKLSEYRADNYISAANGKRGWIPNPFRESCDEFLIPQIGNPADGQAFAETLLG
jgi:hypothetical protein